MNDQGVLITDYIEYKERSPQNNVWAVCLCNAKGRVQFWKVSRRIKTWEVKRRRNEQKEIVLLE